MKLLLSSIHKVVMKLDDHTFQRITDEVRSEVAVAVEGAKNAGVRLHSLDEILGRSIGRGTVQACPRHE